MAEDDIMELLWQNDQILRRSLIQKSTSDKPSPLPPPPPTLILHDNGSGEGEKEDAMLLHHQPSNQNLFMEEDEMASWLYHHDLLYSSDVSTLATQPHIPLSYDPPAERPFSARWPANFMNFSRLRGNVNAGGKVEAVPSIPVVGSSATWSSSANESCLTLAIHGPKSQPIITGGVSVHGLGRKEKDVAIQTASEIAGTPSSPITDDRMGKEREEIQVTREARDSTARKRSRTSETHNLTEKRRREKINEKMKTLQELIPFSNKSDKASMLDDAIEYVKSLQTQLQMMLMGGGTIPMMYPANIQQFMPHMAMGITCTNQPPFTPFSGIPFPRPAHIAGLAPSYPQPRYPVPNIQASDPSRVQLLRLQPLSNQPQFPAYMNPYTQVIGLQQMQQPPPSLNQTTPQLSSRLPAMQVVERNLRIRSTNQQVDVLT